MQTTQVAHPAQQYEPQTGNGIFLACAIALGAFLLYAVQQHWITDAFVWIMSNLFDSFSIKTSSILADIALLIVFTLSLFGLFCLFKFFFVPTVVIVIIAVLATVFLTPDSAHPHTVKIKSGDIGGAK